MCQARHLHLSGGDDNDSDDNDNNNDDGGDDIDEVDDDDVVAVGCHARNLYLLGTVYSHKHT